MTGEKFGRLVVVCRDGRRKSDNKILWKCQCECGNYIWKVGCDLLSGNTKSCGCYRRELANRWRIKHHMSDSRLHIIWMGMIQRCYKPKCKAYKYYGEKGVRVCDEWRNDFINFYTWAINNNYQENLSIDRIDVNGNYEPNNCRWATTEEQANNKTTNHFLEYHGTIKTMKQWADELQITYNKLSYRINHKGMTLNEAIDDLGIKY